MEKIRTATLLQTVLWIGIILVPRYPDPHLTFHFRGRGIGVGGWGAVGRVHNIFSVSSENRSCGEGATTSDCPSSQSGLLQISVADPDPGSGAFLTLGSGMGKNPDRG